WLDWESGGSVVIEAWLWVVRECRDFQLHGQSPTADSWERLLSITPRNKQLPTTSLALSRLDSDSQNVNGAATSATLFF
ncbi:uncharacterized protein PpBr36_05723, partial [Pyricularia pennisetigena]|uniref:uncharacterized protein n=1 Tax=Pyricularia pennisetigena TaxID=1578925 RepID=UPI00114E1A80